MVRLEQLHSKLLFYFACCLLIACQQAETPTHVWDTDVQLTRKKGVYYYQNQPFDGYLLSGNKGADTLGSVELQEGIKNGVGKKWWPDGKLKFQAHYKNGEYHGSVAEWYASGQPYTKFNYTDGKEQGKQQAWRPNGKIKANYEVIGDRKYGLTGIKNCSNAWEN